MDLPSPALATYAKLFEETPVDRIRRVKAGLPAQRLAELRAVMDIPSEKLFGWIGIPGATARRKLRDNTALSLDESERTLGMARLVGLVVKIVAESGTSESFDAGKWTARWLDRPNAALGGRYPGQFMDTADGRRIVEALVARMQSGAYS